MAYRFILLVLPALALARIDVEIMGDYTGGFGKLVEVNYSGIDVSIISDAERTTFNLTEFNLKNAVSKYIGKLPDNVYVRSPTPWGDLYSRYGWQQVTRVLVPSKRTVITIDWISTVVVQRIFENNSTKPAIFSVGISKPVTNTISSAWSTEGELSVGEKINYGINIDVDNFDGRPSFSYTSSWGKNTQQSQTVTVGATSNMYITLQPGEVVVAQLEATRGSTQIEMEYMASLYGYIAANYAHKYNSYNFWQHDIGSVMNSGGLSNLKKSREVINIEFYANAKVIVRDKQRGDILMVS